MKNQDPPSLTPIKQGSKKLKQQHVNSNILATSWRARWQDTGGIKDEIDRQNNRPLRCFDGHLRHVSLCRFARFPYGTY
jgi:hypothetical protein